MTIDEMIRDILDKEERYALAKITQESAYDEMTRASSARLKAYESLRVAMFVGKAVICDNHAVHKDDKGTLHVVPLAIPTTSILRGENDG